MKCTCGQNNSKESRFCADCGEPLAGVCPSGHRNAATQRYCGDCGESLEVAGRTQQPVGEPLGTVRGDFGGARFRVDDDGVVLDDDRANDGQPGYGGDDKYGGADISDLFGPGPHISDSGVSGPDSRSDGPVKVGATFTLRDGSHATIAKASRNHVWLDIRQDGNGLGSFKFPRQDVEAALARDYARKREANEHPGKATDADSRPQSSPGTCAADSISSETPHDYGPPPPPPPNYNPPRAAGSGLPPTPASAGGATGGRFTDWWRRPTTRGRVLVIGLLGAVVLVTLNATGAFQSSDMRECVKYSVDEYESSFGKKPGTADEASLKRVCQNLIDQGLWR